MKVHTNGKGMTQQAMPKHKKDTNDIHTQDGSKVSHDGENIDSLEGIAKGQQAAIYRVKGNGAQPIERLSDNTLKRPVPEHDGRDMVDKKPQVGSVCGIIVLAIVSLGFIIVRVMMPF